MKDGDLSNSVSGRFLFVFEGLVANVKKDREQAMRLYLKARQYRRALRLFEPSAIVRSHLWDLTWRHDVRTDVVTFLRGDVAEHVEKFVDLHNLPVPHVLSTTPEDLSKELSRMPDVLRVFDPDPLRAVTAWGHRGVWVGDPYSFRPMES